MRIGLQKIISLFKGAADPNNPPTNAQYIEQLIDSDGVPYSKVVGNLSGTIGKISASQSLTDTVSATEISLSVMNNNLLFSPDSNSWAREYGNFNVSLLASAARTATTVSAQQTNYNNRGLLIYVNVTAIAATPSIVVNIQGIDTAISGNAFTLLSSAAITATGQYMLHVYPGISEIANVKASSVLPKTWRVQVVHDDADSITYSVAASLIV